MRIIGGAKRGARLKPPAPSTRGIRPTPDMVRESLFNILGQDLSGIAFLDLFAGTGAVGLEAVSRGAARCVLVDRSPEAAALCRDNARRLGMEERVQVLELDARRALERLAARGARFDVVFAGPPFGEPPERVALLGAALASLRLLEEGGVFVLQAPRAGFGPPPEGLRVVDDRAYGSNRLVFHRPAAGTHGEGEGEQAP